MDKTALITLQKVHTTATPIRRPFNSSPDFLFNYFFTYLKIIFKLYLINIYMECLQMLVTF